MEAVFLKLLNMSINAGWLILALAILRLFYKKEGAPRALWLCLWAFVGVRLVCPFSFESVLSLIPSAETVPGDIVHADFPMIQSGIPAVNSVVNPLIAMPLAPNVGDSANPMQIIVFVASIVWMIGVAVMISYGFVSFLRLHRRVAASLIYRENIYFCDGIDTPFILGVFKPHIYLPSGIAEEQIGYVTEHEKAHLKRKDHIWKILGFALLAVYWYNPLVWLAYVLFCHDIEFACDEKVIKNMNGEDKKGYSEALVACSVRRRAVMVCPLAFGEVGVKERIKFVASYKRPAFWAIAVSVVILITSALCFMTTPASLTYTAADSYTDNPNVDVRIIDLNIDKDDPYLVMEWDNRTGAALSYGTEFHMYRIRGNKRIDCLKPIEVGWELPAFSVWGEWANRTIELSLFDLSYAGDYELEFNFSADGEDTEYTAHLRFNASRKLFSKWIRRNLKSGGSEGESHPELFAEMSDLYIFSSGIGNWTSEFELNPDGTFTGRYEDLDMGFFTEEYPYGTIFICEFSGKFTTPTEYGENTYSTRLEYLNIGGTPGDVYYENGYRYIYAEPIGFDNAHRFLIYSPGVKISDLPDGYAMWLHSFLNVDTTETLPFYGIYNVSGEQGFVEYSGN